ncbi:tetraprenyl-beta-curcumene synthase family protein [Paenibacillus sp. CCS19]|uniref:tetraprenyl-beta-curcumene synthase family protein n=1 Tax=Paenibacillus sp. CCS19 TaxID=3158387 RepID=UPI00295E95E3|nr:tetraprenyl-beta-curcumene synthase family protein [Paenibacillus cellulosilyticus]
MPATSKRAAKPGGALRMMFQVYKYVLPDVRKELAGWKRHAAAIPDQELREQALASIATKQFHCEGGAIYAAASAAYRPTLIALIVALQTISDYLDNLCDRSTSLDPDDFRLLHQSMLDAIDPSGPIRDYYANRAEREDGGYLTALVRTCQQAIRQLPSYACVQPYVTELVGLYVDLQVYKHIRIDLREDELIAWRDRNGNLSPQLQWNEFAAATGSTLGMFMLFLAASMKDLLPEDARLIRNSYFPHVCGLHIMLDYLIDQEEDRHGGDLNFCTYYPDQETLLSRIILIVERAREDVGRLPDAGFHRLIIEGLLALYLSDPKVRNQRDVRLVARKLMRNSPWTRLFFYMNSIWIRTRQA